VVRFLFMDSISTLISNNSDIKQFNQPDEQQLQLIQTGCWAYRPLWQWLLIHASILAVTYYFAWTMTGSSMYYVPIAHAVMYFPVWLFVFGVMVQKNRGKLPPIIIDKRFDVIRTAPPISFKHLTKIKCYYFPSKTSAQRQGFHILISANLTLTNGKTYPFNRFDIPQLPELIEFIEQKTTLTVVNKTSWILGIPVVSIGLSIISVVILGGVLLATGQWL